MGGFEIAGVPKTFFETGAVKKLPDIISSLIKNEDQGVLFISGSFPVRSGELWNEITGRLEAIGIPVSNYTVTGEPSPEIIDEAVRKYGKSKIGAIAAVGGGSVLDAGKAISAMLTKSESVLLYLEDVGDGRKHDGVKIPFIAVPTTAGTGSESTKNAVIGRVGENGFKKSLRHDNFIPDIAVIDPSLLTSCPPDVIVSCGMDAFTQLIESYVSTTASPFTDALALNGIEHVRESIERIYHDRNDIAGQSSMAYAAYLSGITLAHAGLGVIHGLAGVIGGLFNIPHGVICANFLEPATRATILALRKEHGDNSPFMKKYSRAGAALAGRPDMKTGEGAEALIDNMAAWSETFGLPRLGEYGFTEKDAGSVAELTSCKNNPVNLNSDEIKTIILQRI